MSLSFNEYQLLERQSIPFSLSNMPVLEYLEPEEICFILRRRKGWTIPQAAEKIGVSRYWYNMMEQGKACMDRLFLFWGEYEGK